MPGHDKLLGLAHKSRTNR